MADQDVVIRVKNLTKKYKLYNKPVDRLKEALHPFRKSYHHDFTALDNVSFEIKKGQTVGIIGKNGSGKSTLLKILTGVLSPTSGEVEVQGKVAALLELGAGFNPELTGYENIFLNGSLMGYSREEMLTKVDAIIEFADIGEFVHQPVKNYSSGMFVRLAFAVAVAVMPDILIVDEALAVGDVRFQMKCIRKFKEFVELGKTIIFVGHDVGAINSFCTQCIWINDGRVVGQGYPKNITDDYISFMLYGMIASSSDSEPLPQVEEGWISTKEFSSFGDKEAEIAHIRVTDTNGSALKSLLGGERVNVDISLHCDAPVKEPIFGFIVKDRLGSHIFGGNTYVHKIPVKAIAPGVSEYQFQFDFPHLSNGDYALTLAVADGLQEDHVQKCWVHDCFVFKVNNPDEKYKIGNGLVLNKGLEFRHVK